MGTTNAFGHGLGSEIMLPVILGSKFVTLEVSSSQIPDTQIREISFNLFNLDTGITLKDVTYFIMAEKSNELFTNMAFLAQKKGEGFGPFGKLY